jgi:hypothetical protein
LAEGLRLIREVVEFATSNAATAPRAGSELKVIRRIPPKSNGWPALSFGCRKLWKRQLGHGAGIRSLHEALYLYWINHPQAFRSGRWKLLLPHPSHTLGGRSAGKDGKPAKYVEPSTRLALF